MYSLFGPFPWLIYLEGIISTLRALQVLAYRFAENMKNRHKQYWFFSFGFSVSLKERGVKV